jgi:hypothetical protein
MALRRPGYLSRERPVALRPRLLAGLPFRSSVHVRPYTCYVLWKSYPKRASTIWHIFLTHIGWSVHSPGPIGLGAAVRQRTERDPDPWNALFPARALPSFEQGLRAQSQTTGSLQVASTKLSVLGEGRLGHRSLQESAFSEVHLTREGCSVVVSFRNQST